MDRILNERTTADALSLSVKTLQAWRRQKRGLAYIKLGRSIGYKESDIEAFLKRSRVAISEQK